MSSGRGLLAVGLGLLTGGLAFAAAGAIGLGAVAPIVAGLAFTAVTSLVMGGAQEQPTSAASQANQRAPEELQINTATEARAIPVVFGRVRIGGNITRYDKRSFSSKAIYREIESETVSVSDGGGKGGFGGGETTTVSNTETDQFVGFLYRLSWDVAYCCGPVDQITGFYTSPGERNLLSNNPDKTGDAVVNPINFNATDRVQRSISDGGEEFPVEGSARFYSGSATQTRYSTDDHPEAYENHRHVCLVHFRNFKIGSRPSPPSFVMEVERLPRALDAGGSAIAGFYTRGSTSSGNPHYNYANPAAAMFEILTNDVWGAGVPHDQIDTASFIQASAYFATNHIGLSFTLSNQDRMSEAINFLRDHVQTLVLWTGEKVKLVCLMDRANAYATLNRVTRDQVEDPVVNRPTWPSTVNEIRINFVNRQKAHKPHTVVAQDLGSIAAVGRIQSRQIDLNGYPTRSLAQRQAQRFLVEAAYPGASLKFRMNRLHAGMEPGSFIQFVWPDWTDGLAVTFWRIVEIDDDATDSGMLEITLIEDPYAVSYETANSEPDDFSTPDSYYEGTEDIDDDDLSLGDDHTTEETGEFGPAITFEPPSVATGGARTGIVAVQRFSGYTAFMSWNWAIEGEATTTPLAVAAPWGFFGTIGADIPITRKAIRELEIDLTLENEDDMADLLEAATFLETAADHYSDLTATGNAYFLVNDELMRIGWATDEGSGVARLTGILRGVLGTEVAEHSADDVGVFITSLDAGFYFNVTGIPVSTDIEFTGDQVTLRGSTVDDTQITFYGPNNEQFDGRSTQPPAPRLKQPAVDDAGDWTIELRARTFLPSTAGRTLNWPEELNLTWAAMPLAYGLFIDGRDGANGTGNSVATYALETEFTTSPGDMPAELGITEFRWIPTDTAGTGAGAFINLEATPTGGVQSFRIYSLQSGRRSLEYLVIDP